MDKGVTVAFFGDHVFNELLKCTNDYLLEVEGCQGRFSAGVHAERPGD
jgi:hypothetical protein